MSGSDIDYLKETIAKLDKRFDQSDRRIAILEKFVVQVEAREEERRKIAGKIKWFFSALIAFMAVYISYMTMQE
jgi:hypothetical protein